MDKKQAQHIITELFRNPFDPDRYKLFLQNLLNNFEARQNKYYKNARLWDKFWPHINYYERIGKYTDPNGVKLDLLIVEVPSFTKLERARTTLRNLVVKHLNTFGDKDYALVAFYAEDDRGEDWRFSFIKIEHEAWKDEKGKIKLKEELTPAKRYSYLVGAHENSHTASKQLLPLLEMDYADPRIEEIEAAFSIEKVTDEFFNQYKALFLNLAEHLKKQPLFKIGSDEEMDQRVSRFAKKLLGQIVFLYFLQKKKWLGVPKGGRWGDGEKGFMRKRYNNTTDVGGSYYHDFLQYLFYEALADARKDQKDPGYYARFDCRVPFLNGGLFEADYDWKNETIDLPNTFFHNNEKTRNGDEGTGILDVFDRYNFTVKEDEPLEKEVAVDPEMLGKVFENMLEVTERKSKGAFYTPREIVHYMCQESLIHYLDNRLNTYTTAPELSEQQGDIFGDTKGQQSLGTEEINVPTTDLDTLIRKGHLALENDTRVLSKGRETDTYKFQLPESVREYAKDIDKALADIKVCDPAIGSGAFPLGLLYEIVNARLALAPHSGNNQSTYELKRHVIAKNHYGVDIDPSAIDIARLRLWLSLIVDEDNFDDIEALPNLDYKIVCGNSLVGIIGMGKVDDIFNPKFSLLSELEQKKNKFFNTTDHARKIELTNEINELIYLISDGKEIFDFQVYFSEVWHENGGFDVVIGNPPYVQIQKFSGQLIQKEWEQQNYETFAKTGDIYCLFYEKGHQLLKEKGALTYITSNKWMRAAYGEKLRRFFSKKTQLLTLIDFSSFQVFETATVDTNVLMYEKSQRYKPVRACVINPTFTRTTPIETFVQKNSIEMPDLSSDSWVITDRHNYEIKKRIEQVGTPLKEWDISIYRGILTGFNEAFIIDGKIKDELVAADPKSGEIIKPILRGRDIKRYYIDFVDLWLINTHNGYGNVPPIDVNNYPAIKSYLNDIEKRRTAGLLGDKAKKAKGLFKRDDQGKTPYNLRNCAYIPDFENEKIVWGNMALSCQFAIANAGLYINAPSPLISGGDRYLLAVLNSTVGDYYIRSVGVTRSGGYFEYKPMFVEKLPIPQLSAAKKRPFEVLANYVLTTTKNDQKLQSAYFEQLIDGLVYELYFPEEIKLAGKDILMHIGNLSPITGNMNDEEQLAIIQNEFDRLYNPNHPVRNNLETLGSVEVVRTIRDALERK